ncbi:MAG: hypothetical protein WC911_02150 [Thermoleophilia bacterium]
MTPEQLQAIEDRLKAATRGPWTGECDSVIGSDGYEIAEVPTKCILGTYLLDPNPPQHWAIIPNGSVDRSKSESYANASLIAHAPEDLRALIEEVRRLRKIEEVDRKLLWGAVHNAGRKTKRGPRWAHVRNALGTGSTTAQELCREHGMDPDEEIGK